MPRPHQSGQTGSGRPSTQTNTFDKAGEYIVRVDAFSMCGQASAQWTVTVTAADGSSVRNPATWQVTDADTRGTHGLGAGRLALEFTM